MIGVQTVAMRGAEKVAAPHKLFLVFHLGGERFALDTLEVAEVLARRPLKPIAQAPLWVAGVFAHRGQLVPVLDLAALAFGQAAVLRTSTRLVLVHYRVDPQQPQALLGLILEHANQTLRCDPEEFRPYGLDQRATPYLGPVREDAQGLMQRISVAQLLDDNVRELLFSGQAAP